VVYTAEKSAMPDIGISSLSTFGDLLKYFRRRAQLTQRELAIAVGYTEGHVSRLEKNQRPPDLATVAALFVPALGLEEEPEAAAQLMQLAASARAGQLQPGENLTISGVQETIEISENAESIPSNLPIQLTTFIGRQGQIAEITRLLSRENPTRLVTLTGPGGIGKTRLALETTIRLSHHYPDGIWFIDLASISDPNLVLSAVTSTLGVPESRDAHPIRALTRHLGKKQTLLILDNCEQVIGAAAELAKDILQTCPRLQILGTSREILNITGEIQFRVPSLSLSNENSAGSTSLPSEAVQLFVERAQAALPSFVLTDRSLPAATQICHLVDGMPLGIELAAAKVTVLSVEQIAKRLQDSFQILGGGRVTLPHHQTLEATIQWSYDLLPDEERALLQRLSVFSGGWILEAAEAVTSDETLIPKEHVLDLLSQLINKSLVMMIWPGEDETRYTLLQSIHDFARRKLGETGIVAQMRARHFDYFFSVAQAARLFGEDTGRWLDRLEAELDNFRLALAWSLEANVPERGAGLILPILDFYWYRGFSAEAREWMEKFLGIEAPASPLRALLLQKAGWLRRAEGNFSKAEIFLKRALEMALEIDDQSRAALALMDLGLSTRDQGDHEQAIAYFSQALIYARESGDKRIIGVILYTLAQSYDLIEDLNTSRKLWEEGLSLMRIEGDKAHIAWGLEGLAGAAYLEKDFAGARKFHLESLQFKLEVMDKLGIAYSLEGLAQVSAAQEEPERAAVLWGAANRLREALNVPIESSRAEIYTSLIPTAQGQLGEEAFDNAWKKGKAMKLNEAIELSLGLLGT